MLSWYQHLPLLINPVAFSIGSFSVRWYALAYVVGFAVVYFILRWRIKKGEAKNIYQITNNQLPLAASETRLGQAIFKKIPNSKSSNTKYEIRNTVFDFLLYAFIAALLGGRIGYVLFYNLPYYWAQPLASVWPYDVSSGQYTGLYGMSYHGALIAIGVMTYFFCQKNKLGFWRWADFVAPTIGAGYFFGRIGNFLNGELYGRITTSPLGMYFAQDPFILRHPSQLYEAFTEGLLLFVILWSLRGKKYPTGTLFLLYIIGYGALRFGVEFFRQPDVQIGLLGGYFALGQLLSLAMVGVAGIGLVWKTKKKML